MDYDNDGFMDIISGSYDPGDIYLIRGLGDGKYAKVESITDIDGTPLVHHPAEMKRYKRRVAASDDPEKAAYSDENSRDRVASFGSWAATIDWDADHDLDMLIGAFDGSISLRRNEGTRDSPEYSPDVQQVTVDGKLLLEEGHANPVVADWDGDGLQDLVVGSSNGRISYYRNVGSLGKPAFGPRDELVAARAPSKFMFQCLDPGEFPAPGVRAQIWVDDYNGDGLLDLLVGDYSNIISLDPKWTDAQRAEFAMAFQHFATQIGKAMKVRKEAADKYRAALEVSKADMKAATEEMQRKMEKLEREGEVSKKALAVSDKVWEQFDKMIEDAPVSSHVWLYLRKPVASKSLEATGG